MPALLTYLPCTGSAFGGRCLMIAIIGMLAGYSCLPGSWLHDPWLILSSLVCARFLSFPVSRSFWPVWTFLGWMTLRSVFSAGNEWALGLAGVSLLVLALMLFSRTAQNPSMMASVGVWTGHLTALAALISIGWHLRQWGVNFEDHRLQNLLVYGGLNPVCTGLLFGFSGLWLCALPLSRFTTLSALILMTAAFCSGSRGAMLSLLVGHGVLLAAHGLRRGWRPLLVLAVSALLFSLSGMAVERPPEAAASSATGISQPWERAIHRPNDGRRAIYVAGWRSIETSLDGWIGIGEWSTKDRWKRFLPSDPWGLSGHLHSVFLATLVHGGVIGLGLLLALIGHAARHAWARLREGDALWPCLFSYGLMALVFDGESLGYLLTLPRFETPLFWLPVMQLLTSRAALMDRPA
jgi:O-antigen ligase